MFELFLLLFIMITIQPIVRQWWLETLRKKWIKIIEQKNESRIILLIHRQEIVSLFGLPIYRYIDVNDSEEILRAIYMTDPHIPLEIILHTPGGLILASLQIARAIKQHKGKVTAYIPYYAMSGGTLIALASNEIVMCEHAILGPVDPIIGGYPAVSLVKLIKDKPVEKIDDKFLILADEATKAIQQMQEGVKEILEGRVAPKDAEKIAKSLTEGQWTHDHAITFQRARKLKLPVVDTMPGQIMQLMSLFRQPTQKQQSVWYTPGPIEKIN